MTLQEIYHHEQRIFGSNITAPKSNSSKSWASILQLAICMMEMGCEPRSALKQCANDACIPYGNKMKEFVEWAEAQL